MKKTHFKKPRRDKEHLEQAQFIEWCRLEVLENRIPDLGSIYAVPNGGLRNARTAAALKREGVKAGIPDLVLPRARGGYFGLYVEMKTDGGTIGNEQIKVGQDLTRNGYKVIYCFTCQEAIEGVLAYLAEPQTKGSI